MQSALLFAKTILPCSFTAIMPCAMFFKTVFNLSCSSDISRIWVCAFAQYVNFAQNRIKFRFARIGFNWTIISVVQTFKARSDFVNLICDIFCQDIRNNERNDKGNDQNGYKNRQNNAYISVFRNWVFMRLQRFYSHFLTVKQIFRPHFFQVWRSKPRRLYS